MAYQAFQEAKQRNLSTQLCCRASHPRISAARIQPCPRKRRFFLAFSVACLGRTDTAWNIASALG